MGAERAAMGRERLYLPDVCAGGKSTRQVALFFVALRGVLESDTACPSMSSVMGPHPRPGDEGDGPQAPSSLLCPSRAQTSVERAAAKSNGSGSALPARNRPSCALTTASVETGLFHDAAARSTGGRGTAAPERRGPGRCPAR